MELKKDDQIQPINFEEVSFRIITFSGLAKTNAFLAIQAARKGSDSDIATLLKEADENIILAQQQHMEVIHQEANGVQHPFSVIFVHAEDQMMSAQMVIELAKEMIELYKKINQK